MVIEVVLSEVGKGCSIKFDFSHAVLHDRMAGNFHGHSASTRLPDFGEDFLDINRLRRCMRGGALLIRDDVFDRSNQPAAL